MGSSVVTRSYRALGAGKLPITRVVPSLVSISLSNKGEHSLALPFFGIGVKTDLFQPCGHC